MKTIVNFLKNVIKRTSEIYSRWETYFLFILLIPVTISFGLICKSYGFDHKLVTLISILYVAFFLVIIRLIFTTEYSRHNAKFRKLFERSYNELYREREDIVSGYRQYSQDVKEIQHEVESYSENVPDELAMLSNLSQTAVHAPTIKSMIGFSRTVKYNDTVFLIRMDHDEAVWHMTVSGRSIDEAQAQSICDGIKKKIEELAKKDKLIKKSGKIYN